MKPTRLLDPRFKYVPAEKTNIRATFARIRREQAQATAEKHSVVTPIIKRKVK